jgi:predicted nucleic acid-binding protein
MAKPQPDSALTAWLHNVDEDLLFVSTITLGELRLKIDRLTPGARRRSLELWLTGELPERFSSRILVVDLAVANEWGAVKAECEARDRRIDETDCFLAATARVHQLTIVTRETERFADAGCELFDPWNSK